MIPVHRGKIEGGRFIPDEELNYSLWLCSLENMPVDVIVRKHRKDRTNNQNEYYWGVIIKLISDSTGYTLEDTHSLMKSMFLKAHITVKDKRYTVIRSTSQLSTVEFGEYIEKIKQWAAQDLGIYIPDAEQVHIER